MRPYILENISLYYSINNRLIAEYGGKKALIRHLKARISCLFGSYNQYRQIQWPAVKRLVFVCKGNICRSAYAQAKAEQLGITTASAGLNAKSDGPADPLATKNARMRGVGLDTHKATRINHFEFHNGDLVLCMEPKQAAAVAPYMTHGEQQISLLGLWSRNRRPYLHDPYGHPGPYWTMCLDVIDEAVQAIGARVDAQGIRE